VTVPLPKPNGFRIGRFNQGGGFWQGENGDPKKKGRRKKEGCLKGDTRKNEVKGLNSLRGGSRNQIRNVGGKIKGKISLLGFDQIPAESRWHNILGNQGGYEGRGTRTILVFRKRLPWN